MTYRVALTGTAARQRARMLLDKAPDGYMVTIAEPTRSDAQNKALWAKLADVALAKPGGRVMPPQDWKIAFMHSLGCELRVMHDLDGKPFLDGYRSSKLSVTQMAELLAFIDAWGTANGVQWSEPSA